MLKTGIKFENVDSMEACKYIALTSTEQEYRLGPLKRVLPRRRCVNGTRPGITGEDPLNKDTGNQDQWEFPPMGNGLTEQEKKLVMAKVMKTAVLAIFKTHTYSIAERFYLQQKGGPIGLRLTSCVARLVMLWCDDKLIEAMERMNIKTIAGARYMDTSGYGSTLSDWVGGLLMEYCSTGRPGEMKKGTVESQDCRKQQKS